MTLAFPLWLAMLLMSKPSWAQVGMTVPWLAWWSLTEALLLGLGLGGLAWYFWRRLRLAEARNRELGTVLAELRQMVQRSETKARQLDGAIAAMSDGVMVMDTALRLVGWNGRFPDLAGVPHRALRIGMPIQEVLRLQAEAGEFGAVDTEAEVARRMAVLRDGAVVERQVRSRPDGSRLELRRSPLPGGGFVTLYTRLSDPVLATPGLSEAFRAEWNNRLPRLLAAAADGDAPATRQAAHTLRGIAANADWPKIAAMLGAVEAAAVAEDVTEMRLLANLLPLEPPGMA